MSLRYLRLALLIFIFAIASRGYAQVDTNTKNDKMPNPNELVKQANLNNGKFFIENKGQWDEQVLAMTQLNGMKVWITKKGITFDYYKIEKNKDKKEEKQTGHAYGMNFSNNNQSLKAKGNSKLDFHFNYFLGNDKSKWASNVGVFKEFELTEMIEGIDTRYFFNEGNFRYDFIVKPNADLSKLKFNLEGGNETKINSKGELEIETSIGTVTNKKLLAYQEDGNGNKSNVNCNFIKNTDGSYSFDLGNYDRSKRLIIDPTVVFSTDFTETGQVTGLDVTNDQNGNIYITGSENYSSFPVTYGAYSTGTSYNAYLSKFDKTGQYLLYSSVFGGSDVELGTSLDFYKDNFNNEFLYIAGFTFSSDFPVTNVIEAATFGVEKAFLLILNAKGNNNSDLYYSTLWGGSISVDLDFNTWNTTANDIRVRNDGYAYICGQTTNSDYPTTINAIYQFDATKGNGVEGFFTVINPKGNGTNDMYYSTYLRDNITRASPTITPNPPNPDIVEYPSPYHKQDVANSIEIYNNKAYIVGFTNSENFLNISGQTSFQTAIKSQNWFDGFLAIVDPTLNSNNLVYSTYFGGDENDYIIGVDVDNNGKAFLTGGSSNVNGFPANTTNAYSDPNLISNSTNFAFFAIINPLNSGINDLNYCTKFGESSVSLQAGNRLTLGTDVQIDRCNRAIISGSYMNVEPDFTTLINLFPLKNNIVQPTSEQGFTELFLTVINPLGNNSNDLVYSTLVSGTNLDAGREVYDLHPIEIMTKYTPRISLFEDRINFVSTSDSPDFYNVVALFSNTSNNKKAVLGSIILDESCNATQNTCCTSPNTGVTITRNTNKPNECCYFVQGSISIDNCSSISKLVLEKYENFSATNLATINAPTFVTVGSKKVYNFGEFCTNDGGLNVILKYYDNSGNLVCVKEASATCKVCCDKIKEIKITKITNPNPSVAQCCIRIDGIVDMTGGCFTNVKIFESGNSTELTDINLTNTLSGLAYNKGKFNFEPPCITSGTKTYELKFYGTGGVLVCTRTLTYNCVANCCELLNDYFDLNPQSIMLDDANPTYPECTSLILNLPSNLDCIQSFKVEQFKCGNQRGSGYYEEIVPRRNISTNYQGGWFCCRSTSCWDAPIFSINIKITFYDLNGNECIIYKNFECEYNTSNPKKSNPNSNDNNDGISLDNQIFDYSVQPNPSSDRTSLRFNLSDRADTKIEIFNSTGQSVMLLKSQIFAKGENLVDFDAKELQNGAYFIRISTTSGSNVTIPLTIKR